MFVLKERTFIVTEARTRAWAIVIAVLLFGPAIASAGAGQDRRDREARWADDGLTILPNRPTYVLPIAYNTNPNIQPFSDLGEPKVEKTEVKFQISLKAPLIRRFFADNAQLYFGYTQLVLWQLYNHQFSSPFRDTNYEPEVFANWDTDWTLGPVANRGVQLGAVHQSNGRAEPLSRSWNRIYAQFILEDRDWTVMIKPWYRIPESAKDDSNPDIYKYLGYGELRWAWKRGTNVYAALLRNNLIFHSNKVAIELDWSYQLTTTLKSYVQYFNGYGESLLDYNHPNNRLGVGLALTDWL
jgi:phospholipase A1